ncbi:unnamed protein product [Rotaria magnacalcarata]|uniref:Peptidase S1 domain-containing protein n=1 Tax=Rotaria magnacalcarata TaxID=392030 RepID=A0A819E7W1_9BILA|nr:unnamed protein product [Rotaria magnacalcarata]
MIRKLSAIQIDFDHRYRQQQDDFSIVRWKRFYVHNIHSNECHSKLSSELPLNCQWLIVGSSHQSIGIEFDYLLIPISDQEYIHTGCRRGSIGLWTVGLKHEKLEICGDRHSVRVGGIGQMLMIELRIVDPKLEASFRMNYQLFDVPQISSTPPTFVETTTFPFEKHINNPDWLYSECGLTWTVNNRYYNEISSRIVGGRQALAHSHPWQVLLYNRGQFCGASVLNRNWIITAAHCVNGTKSKHLLVEFGIHDRYRIEPSRIARTIKKVYPAYSGKSTRWMHDIALLQLYEPLVFNPFIRPICLSAAQDTVKQGERTLITGWGSTQGTGNFRYLHEVQVPIQSNDQCGLQGIRRETTLCAGLCENSTCDSCQGDSGGPMVLLRHGRWHLVGLISWGFSCAGLGVYTKVSYYSEWILKTIHDSSSWM